MSEPAATRGKAGKQSQKGVLILLALVAVAVVVVVVLVVNGGRGGPGQGSSDQTELLEQTRVALASTENLETSDADAAWQTIFAITPQDASVALNRALNRGLRVDELAGQAMNATLQDSERMAARAQLPSAIEQARTAIDDYEKISGDSVVTLWLRSRIDLHQASLLPSSMTRTLRNEVYNRLAEAVLGEAGKSPESIVLAGPLIEVLDELEDPIDGLPRDLLQNAAETVAVLSDRHPDNLFLALRAARLNIAVENPKAARLVLRTQQLAKAIEPSLIRQTKPIGLTPDELVAEITDAIAEGQWSQASNRMLLWFNVLNPTEIVKTDRRRASPHPLDRLSFDSLRRLSAAVVKSSPLEEGSQPFVFDTTQIAQASGVTVLQPIDFDIDLDDDLATVSESGLLQLWQNDGHGGWSLAGETSLDIRPTGMIVVDLFMVDSSDPQRLKTVTQTAPSSETDYAGVYRHNTFPSLVAIGDDGVRIIRVDGRPGTATSDRLSQLDRDAGLAELSNVTAAIAGDLEGDGDLDLVFATKNAGIRLFINRGNRTFFEVTQHDGGFDPHDPVAAMAIADLDRDLDLDILTVHPNSGRVGLLENLLHLQFRGRLLEGIPAIEKASFIAVEDIDANVSWDLIVGGDKQSAIVFSQTADAGAWTVDRVEAIEHPSSDAVVADFDNDSWNELLTADASDTSISRIGPWGFGSWASVDAEPGVSRLCVSDFNRDGKMDYACLRAGSPLVRINRTETPWHFINVRFKGIDDNAANSGRVNHFAIGSVLELRFGPHYRSKIITSPASHFGLGVFDKASSIRVVLPNGLTQTIRGPSVDTLIEEEQKLKGSCPYLYAWDGERYVFMTDCLWAAPLGLQVARGVVAQDRPWEYLKVDGRNVKPRDGRYDFRITEELWEVAYIDHIAMSAVDHPADVEIWTNEKVGPGEIATPTIFAFRKDELRDLKKAVDTNGRDVTDLLRDRDKAFVQGFDRRLRQGLCPAHWIDLDFGELATPNSDSKEPSMYLVLTGWILPTDTSLNIQIDQNPELPAIEFPSVWVPDPSQAHRWREAIPFMGFPGGKTKTIVVDVSDILVTDDPRLRIRTSAQIYWDSAKLAIQSEPPALKVHDLGLLSAEVAYHGFSKRIAGDPQQPETYDYQQASLSALWPPLRGPLTRFGDCTDLVKRWDDSMVVISSGDEMRFSFSLPDPSVPDPSVPDGWRRDFVLHCVGWDKDADLNTLAGQTTGPLPFRKMASYPPTPAQRPAAGQVEHDNRSHLGRHQSFRSFWHRGGEPEPSRFRDNSFDAINRSSQ